MHIPLADMKVKPFVTFYTYSYYYIPAFSHYDANDTVNMTISGEFNNEFMVFDNSTNKMIFHGLMLYSVGRYILKLELQSTLYPELRSEYELEINVENISTHAVAPTLNS